MLESLSICNFKAFGGLQRIPLRPITLVFGPNSSGKSSLLQTLLLLKQTLEEAERPETVLLPKGRLVDLGSFRELIFGHDLSRSLQLGFGVSFESEEDVKVNRTRRRMTVYRQAKLAFDFSATTKQGIELDGVSLLSDQRDRVLLRMIPEVKRRISIGGKDRLLKTGNLVLETDYLTDDAGDYKGAYDRYQEFQLNDDISRLERRVESGRRRIDEPSPLLRTGDSRVDRMEVRQSAMEKRLARLSDYSLEHFVEDQRSAHKDAQLALWNFLPAGSAYSLDEMEEYGFYWQRSHGPMRPLGARAVLMPTLLRATRALRTALDGLIYLGPLREYPERHYIFSGNLVAEVGKSGKGMPDLLFKKRGLVTKLNQWLRKFGLDYQIKVKTVRDPDVEDVFTLRLVEGATGITVSPLDVGFGISQLLPIVVQTLLAEDRLICVEQPEIHIHPRLQAEFGSLLAAAIKEKNPNRFLIETHSEHLLLRLQRLIRRRELTPSDVAVIYVSKTSDGAVASELRIDEDGSFLDRWPDGFFEEGFVERFED